VNDDIEQAREQAREHKHIGNSLMWLGLVFMAGAAFFGEAREWMPFVLAVSGMAVMGWMARREWDFQHQWDACADMWAEEQAEAMWLRGEQDRF
jgi:hypothetical protein